MRARLIAAAAVVVTAVLPIAGCGGSPGGTHNIAKNPPVPSLSPLPPPSPTLGDPCLVGLWRQTTGSLLWEGNTAASYGSFSATAVGGAGATLKISYNGSATWDNDGSQPYTASVQDYYANPPTTTLSIQLSGLVTGIITGDYQGSPTAMYWSETTPSEFFGEAGSYGGSPINDDLVHDDPLEYPLLTYSCSATAMTISALMPGGTSPPTTFARVSG